MTGREQVIELMKAGQTRLVAAFESLDQSSFESHSWQRPGGGGGTARILENGHVFERAGVNVSAVQGEAVPPSLVKEHPASQGKPFFATGLSMVLHPRNPFVPAFHANYRYFEIGNGELWWFGGGADMTPAYPFAEDARHFHQILKSLCDRHSHVDYQQLKTKCDEYFYIRHRGEMRGISGIFFDELSSGSQIDWEADFQFVQDGIESILPSYLPVIEKRKDTPYSECEREWQLYRRGRYVEFNLVYDRGTLFGLQTQGNIEAILMSMPPYARWEFAHSPEPGSKEAAALAFFQPRSWV